MSYTYLLEQGEESSAECFLGIPAFVLSRSRNTLEKSSCNDSETESYHDSRYGTTYKPSTAGPGKGASMLCAADSRAKTSAQPGGEQESKASDQDSGPKWQGLSVKFDRDTCLWKTHRCLWEEDLPESLVTLPKWGMMRSGELWERTTLPLPIKGTGSGFWHTPTRHNAKEGGYPSEYKRNSPTLAAEANMGMPAKMWPTPTVNGNYNQKGLSKTSGDGLATCVKMWPTPQASDNRDRGHLGSNAIRRRKMKGKQIGLSQSVSEKCGALNPTWTEWLMGWPIGWTDSRALGTDRWQAWLHSHGKY